MTPVQNLHRRRKRLGLSLLRYYHAFMHGYDDKRTKNECPYGTENLTTAYWEGRRTRYNYDDLNKCDLMTKNVLTLDR